MALYEHTIKFLTDEENADAAYKEVGAALNHFRGVIDYTYDSEELTSFQARHEWELDGKAIRQHYTHAEIEDELDQVLG
jgi:hypothetical protein